MNLHHVEACFVREHGSVPEGIRDFVNLACRQIGDIRPDLFIQQRAQVGHADALGEHTRDVLEHGFDIGIRLVQLRTQQATLSMHGFGNALIEGEALFGVKRRAEAVLQHPAHRPE